MVYLKSTIPCLSSDPRRIRHTFSLLGITTTAGLVNQGVVGSGSSNGNVGAGGVGNIANAANVSRNPIFNQGQNPSSGANITLLNDRSVHGGGQPYRGHQIERHVNQGINKSGNGQLFYRPPPRQQHGGSHGHHSQFSNFGKDQGMLLKFDNAYHRRNM